MQKLIKQVALDLAFSKDLKIKDMEMLEIIVDFLLEYIESNRYVVQS